MKESILRKAKVLLSSLTNPVIAIITAFIMGGLIVAFTGGNPFEAYRVLFTGAFGSLSSLSRTIRFTLPIVMLGFSFGISERSGYFNIGQEGQMYAGAMAIVFAQYFFGNLPPILLLFIMLIVSTLASGLMSFIPAMLKLKLGTNEVIVSMLLNYAMVLLSSYLLLYGPIAEKGKSTALSIDVIPEIEGIVLLLVAMLIILAYAIFYKRSTWGYQLRMIGKNKDFAELSGINIGKFMLVIAFVAGVFSGLSVYGETLGVYHRVYNGFASNLGFYGMTAALIGGDSIFGLVAGALILGSLQSGSISLATMTNTQSEIVLIVQGFVMLFATIKIFKHFSDSRKK